MLPFKHREVQAEDRRQAARTDERRATKDQGTRKPDIRGRVFNGCLASIVAEFKRPRAGRGHASFFTFHINGSPFNTPLTVLR